MLGLKLNHVSKWGPMYHYVNQLRSKLSTVHFRYMAIIFLLGSHGSYLIARSWVQNLALQSGRSPKVVALFLRQTLVATWDDFFNAWSKWNQFHAAINYNHNNIAIRIQIMIHNTVQNLISATKFSSIYLAKGHKRLAFNYHLLTCGVREIVLIWLMQNIGMCLLYKSHQIAHLVSHLINHFSNDCLPCIKKMLPNLVAKMKIYTSFYIIKWLLIAGL